ncbi:putative membrane protein, putative virulence factor [Actinobacteria bacterium IMCC26207]|nr:putative membrane protein, putative virulence factor [Actinobacteria bacterium IMCC26207]
MSETAGGSRAVSRTAAGMGAAAAVSRGFGGIRVLAIAAVLGTTYLGNAFQSSNTVSNVLFELLAAGALSAVLVPTFVGYFERGDQKGAEHLAGELLGVAIIVLGVVALVGMLAAPWIADLLTAAVEDPTIAAEQQALTAFLLLFFIPQVVLYGLGAISTAVLNAKRSFVVGALAPIGNTLVMVGFLLAFRYVAGPDPGLELSTNEKLLLALGGTLGVVAFVAVPSIAVWRSGFSLRPRFSRQHEGLRKVLGLSGWASLQHGFAALLLGAAIIAGGAVEGGVVAYQVGWFFFLAPYGIIAQPIHTTILPELVAEHQAGDTSAFVSSLRWALDSMCVLLLPISALCAALAVPAMSVLAFGSAKDAQGIDLLAAALASLGLGLLPYGAFFLLARAWYVYGNSRVPAIAGGCAAAVGVLCMAAAAVFISGTNLVLALGLAHSLAFLVGSVVLVVSLRGRTHMWILPSLLIPCLVGSVLVGLLVWGIYEWWGPTGKLMDLLALLALCSLALGLYAGFLRVLGVSITQRLPGSGTQPEPELPRV